MRSYLKKILLQLPTSLKKVVVIIREFLWVKTLVIWEKSNYPSLNKISQVTIPGATRKVLVYAIHGMSHGGTEKNLQLIANSLVENYEVFYMYGVESDSSLQKDKLDSRINLVPFKYSVNEVVVPHKLSGMTPHIKEVITENSINLLITASPGYSHYPWNLVRSIPIVLLNIFGAPTLQKNVVSVIYNSKTTLTHAQNWIGTDGRASVRYAPLYKSPPLNSRELGSNLRKSLGILETDFVFGRIGRDDDAIFDPIGMEAWKKIADKYPNSHYIVMSAPPALIKMVESEKIPRVYLLPKSSSEEEVWAFHGALDTFAHFRYDGETSGVAIAESLYIGNPVITHKSHIWNAHAEYLTKEFSRVTEKDDSNGYSEAMEEFMNIKANKTEQWNKMKVAASKIGNECFSPVNYGHFIRELVASI